MTVRTTSRAATRNAELRAAVRAAFPGVSFTVRNGKDGAAAIIWTDGPTREAVAAVASRVESNRPGRPWAVRHTRRASVALIALSYLRAREIGSRYYEERDVCGVPIATGDVRAEHEVRSTWWHLDDDVDAATATPAEHGQVLMLAQLANVDPATVPLDDPQSQVRRRLGRALLHHGDVLDAVLAPADAACVAAHP